MLYPEIIGDKPSLTILTTQTYTGRTWPVIDRVWQVYGMYVLARVTLTRSELDQYSKTKKIDFILELLRCDEDLRERLQASSVGDLLPDLKNKADAMYSDFSKSTHNIF
ncbi:phage tail protein [Edwardsiella tarda]|uniref:phage tail protein n=1 Tax=Edwardsiella tarda TaxID=636 RepID=UPI003F65A14F